MSFFTRCVGAAAMVAVALPPGWAAGGDSTAGALTVQQPWTRATPNGAAVAGGYLTVTNHGTAADTLTGGSFEAAAGFQVHDMTIENGVMKMRPAGPVEIQPGASVTFSPAGRHIMFTGLKRGLKKGETVAGTLTFAHAGSVPVRFTVEGIGARAPAGAAMGGMPGMD